jgi:hypothetical protein
LNEFIGEFERIEPDLKNTIINPKRASNQLAPLEIMQFEILGGVSIKI